MHLLKLYPSPSSPNAHPSQMRQDFLAGVPFFLSRLGTGPSCSRTELADMDFDGAILVGSPPSASVITLEEVRS